MSDDFLVHMPALCLGAVKQTRRQWPMCACEFTFFAVWKLIAVWKKGTLGAHNYNVEIWPNKAQQGGLHTNSR